VIPGTVLLLFCAIGGLLAVFASASDELTFPRGPRFPLPKELQHRTFRFPIPDEFIAAEELLIDRRFEQTKPEKPEVTFEAP
jgi:hypothetical protein